MAQLINDGLPFHSSGCTDLGLSRHHFRRAVQEKRIRCVFKGMHVDAAVPDSRRLRLAAAHLVTPPHAVISDSFASWVLMVDTFRPSERHTVIPTMLVPHGSSRVRAAGVRCRQAIVRDSDVIEVDGLLVTSELRTTSDLLRTLWRPYALAAGDGMARAGLVEPAEVVAYVHRLDGYRGAPQARELSLLIDAGAESAGESWQRLRIIDAGFPRPTTQIHVIDDFGRDRYFDMGYRELLIASEYDGREFHTLAEDLEHDVERREYFERRYGWRFVIGMRETIFGKGTGLEDQLGMLLEMTPRPRRW